MVWVVITKAVEEVVVDSISQLGTVLDNTLPTDAECDIVHVYQNKRYIVFLCNSKAYGFSRSGRTPGTHPKWFLRAARRAADDELYSTDPDRVGGMELIHTYRFPKE